MTITKISRKAFALLLAAVLLAVCLPVCAGAVSLADYEPGTYEVEASLSCYVNAMGGVEFGEPLLTGAILTVADDGSATITLTFTKSSVTIYSVTCDTFVDADPSYVTDDRGVTSGTLGIYDEDGTLITDGVSYTLSDDTALNTNSDEVHYVDSITLPLPYDADSYAITIYINSNVMGVQFCEANDAATSATYSATLTIYWDGVVPEADDAEEVELNSEDMDGLTIYRADADEADEAEEAEAEETETVIAAESSESVAESKLFGTVNAKMLLALMIIGVILIGVGGVSMVFNIANSKKQAAAEKETETSDDEE